MNNLLFCILIFFSTNIFASDPAIFSSPGNKFEEFFLKHATLEKLGFPRRTAGSETTVQLLNCSGFHPGVEEDDEGYAVCTLFASLPGGHGVYAVFINLEVPEIDRAEMIGDFNP